MLFNSATIALALTLASATQGATLTGRGGDNGNSWGHSGGCNGLVGWQRNHAYSGGDEVSYWGSVWQAKEWSYNNPPGDAAGQWNNICPCNGGGDSADGSNGNPSWNKARGDDGNDTQGVGQDKNNDNSKDNNNDGNDWNKGNDKNNWNNNKVDDCADCDDGKDDGGSDNGKDKWDGKDDGKGSDCDCSNASPWSKTAQYPGGSYVTYNGHLWYAQWWVTSNCPGDASGSWTDKGACTKW